MNIEPITLDKALELKGRKATEFFSTEENIVSLIKLVKNEALSLVPVVSTKKGRDEIGSNALKVSKSRKALTGAIELTIADMQTKVKAAKGLIKTVDAELGQVRTDVLKPRNEWQAIEDKKEADRVEAIQSSIANIYQFAELSGSESKDELANLIEAIESIDISEGFAEFTGEAAGAKSSSIKLLNDKIISLAQQEIIVEQETATRIEARINKLRMIPTSLFGKSSHEIQQSIDSITKYQITELDFAARASEAEQAKELVLSQLAQMKEMVLLNEQATASAEPEIEQPLGITSESGKPITLKQDTPAPVQAFKQTQKSAEKTVTITVSEYKSLLAKSALLDHIEENWDGYQAALIQFNNQKAA
jgi:hypothetical protein